MFISSNDFPSPLGRRAESLMEFIAFSQYGFAAGVMTLQTYFPVSSPCSPIRSSCNRLAKGLSCLRACCPLHLDSLSPCSPSFTEFHLYSLFQVNSNPTSLKKLLSKWPGHPSHNFFLSMDYFIGCFIKSPSTHILCPHRKGGFTFVVLIPSKDKPLPTNICIPGPETWSYRGIYKDTVIFLLLL